VITHLRLKNSAAKVMIIFVANSFSLLFLIERDQIFNRCRLLNLFKVVYAESFFVSVSNFASTISRFYISKGCGTDIHSLKNIGNEREEFIRKNAPNYVSGAFQN
jgi:hypothetical protein